jgi:hypothetical protein
MENSAHPLTGFLDNFANFCNTTAELSSPSVGSCEQGNERFYLLDITPCSMLKVNRRFGAKFRLHIPSVKAGGEQSQSTESQPTFRCKISPPSLG